MTKSVDEYTCAMCEGTFDKVNNDEWSDEKAAQELKDNFGETDEAVEVVCDDCYQKIKPIPHAEIHPKQQPSCIGCLYSYLKSEWAKENKK